MKFLSAALLLLAVSGSIDANCCDPPSYSFYLKAGSGISFSDYADVYAPAPPWNVAVQGYDARMGNRAIAELGIGCEFCRSIDVEVSASYRSTFEYRKFQSSVDGDGSYTREFDLSALPILFSVNFLGQNVRCINWRIGCGRLYPMVGAGIGMTRLSITNFRTTGLPPTGGSAPFASFSSENQYTLRRQFTYTALAGFEYNHHDCWAISTGYRWLDAGTFKGPRFLRVDTGSAVDVSGREWNIRFRANEWFVAFKIFL